MENEKELWGHKFKVVNKGLDEADVYSFVDNITRQHGEFSSKLERLESLVKGLASQYTDITGTLQQLSTSSTGQYTNRTDPEINKHQPELSHSTPPSSNGHMSNADREKLDNLEALTRFAERTVIEAAKQANSIVTHAQGQAASEAERIAAESKSVAWRISDEIVGSAQLKAHELLQYAELQGQATKMPAHLVSSDPASKTGNTDDNKTKDILKAAREKIEECAQSVKQQSEKLQTKSQKVSADQVRQMLETIDQQFLSLMDVLQNQLDTADEEQESGLQALPVEASPSGNQFSESVDESADEEQESDLQASLIETAASGNQISEPVDEVPEEQSSFDAPEGENAQTDIFDGTVELALPPPVALDRMLQLHKHLKETPHVDVLNLGGSVDKGITIRILLDSPTQLLHTIGELEEVDEVEEELPDAENRVPSRDGIDDHSIRRVIVSTKE